MIALRCIIVFALFPIFQKCNCDSVLESSFDASANSTAHRNEDGTTTETHYTTCKITTEQLVADARATFTRVLTGACNSKIIDERFDKLERSLNNRLDAIRELIVRSSATMKQDLDFSETYNDLRDMEEQLLTGKNRFPANAIEDHTAEKEFVDKNENNDKRVITSRWNEIELYNNTVHSSSLHDDDEQHKVYTYYWRVSNLIEKLLTWETGRSERSSTFYAGIDGYAMYLRFTPKYFPDGTIFISFGLTRGKNDEKIIWPFPLQLRIEILDLTMILTKNDRPKDRSSRLWDPATVCSSYFWGRPKSRSRIVGQASVTLDNPECVGLSVPRQLLMNVDFEQTAFTYSSSTGKYLLNDSLIVKLTVYL